MGCDHCCERKLFVKHISCRMVKLIITPADAINKNLHFTAVVAIMSLTNSKNWNSHNTTLCIYEALISLDNDYYRQTLLFSSFNLLSTTTRLVSFKCRLLCILSFY